MPQGDVRGKQQALSGHRWLCTFDFTSGFYAVTVAEESRPYTCFYVEGRGYFWCIKMPFGLTGAPSTFAHMTGIHLHDFLADGTMELFVDDGASADDDFDSLISKLRRIFTCIRDRGMSLSPSKSQFFVTDAVFAGASVGPSGVTADHAKLTAIVDWQPPKNALNLNSFLGLTGHFRDLIKDYAKIEAPLRNLLREVDLPKTYSKTTYRRILTNHVLAERWTDAHTDSFLTLKTILTSEPVLRHPKWDGTPFIVTTDGCQEGFGAVLTQRFQTVLPNGRTVEHLHPIAFASKRTSRTEEKYKPFLLEFAALKFALDKFSDIIWGFPIEIETDCQALRDVLINDKLNAAHARWRDSILAHQIVDVRHVPGRLNVVADGISRVGEGSPRTSTDGSTWTVSEDWESSLGLIQDIFQIDDEHTALLTRFQNEPLFLEVIQALLDLDTDTDSRRLRRAQHRASQYMLDKCKTMETHHRARTTCTITRRMRTSDGSSRTRAPTTQNGGHWGRDSIKIALLDRICSPHLDQSIIKAIQECGQCKNFGGKHLHSLLDPITRRHPFELLVGDYLALPKGKGGYHTVGLYLDTFSQHAWAFKYKTAGSAKTTNNSLQQIFRAYIPPETFMSDGGSHFDNNDVRDTCTSWHVRTHIVAAYSPWINGLVEGTNKLLLHILQRLCAPDLNDADINAATWDTLPGHWPDRLDEALQALNTRILPALKFTPKELLLSLPINTNPTPTGDATEPVEPDAIALHLAYAAQQCLDGCDAIVAHASKRKAAFDRRVQRTKPGEVIFIPGSLIQVYRSDLETTLSTARKLLPRWSQPRRVIERIKNSYKLATIDGFPINGTFHARRLRRYHLNSNSQLALDEGRRAASENAWIDVADTD
ncbi:Retrovirus-related Pol polyprotein from transposon opus [Grifola frondosa]|uniref:Retrovirus-related Pol polyprotein from transposon opus n=1 Tax=Grifola frondosa TaxID=5627 RepID=A0A1C7LS27_GRIFR|nr:Retrovirus-related Pol polyprotein from transposon opus [Grifola frondosa]